MTLFNIYQQGGLIIGPLFGAFSNEYLGWFVTMLSGGVLVVGYAVLGWSAFLGRSGGVEPNQREAAAGVDLENGGEKEAGVDLENGGKPLLANGGA